MPAAPAGSLPDAPALKNVVPQTSLLKGFLPIVYELVNCLPPPVTSCNLSSPVAPGPWPQLLWPQLWPQPPLTVVRCSSRTLCDRPQLSFPTKTNLIPRQVPARQWYMHPAFSALVRVPRREQLLMS